MAHGRHRAIHGVLHIRRRCWFGRPAPDWERHGGAGAAGTRRAAHGRRRTFKFSTDPEMVARIRSQGFLGFLKQGARAYPDQQLHLVMRNTVFS